MIIPKPYSLCLTQFKVDGSFTVVPGSEFVVAREATKSNQSNYFLDGKKKTFKEIGSLLREKGIDLDHNRFLILQGEVESIAMMKPKAQSDHEDGLLEYLEDIIGYGAGWVQGGCFFL